MMRHEELTTLPMRRLGPPRLLWCDNIAEPGQDRDKYVVEYTIMDLHYYRNKVKKFRMLCATIEGAWAYANRLNTKRDHMGMRIYKAWVLVKGEDGIYYHADQFIDETEERRN